jgi:hypothetical protein
MRLMCLFWIAAGLAFLKKLIKDSDEDVHASASSSYSLARQLPLGEFNF